MIGFLVHDNRIFSVDDAVAACRALRTFSYTSTESIGNVHVHFYQNNWPNNYCQRNQRFLIVASGTIIFRHSSGNAALKSILHCLLSEQTLEQLFPEFQGPYALLLVDRVRELVCVLTSREGLRYCYVATINNGKAFSVNLLLLAALTGGAPSPEGVRQFVHLGTTMEGHTLFADVNRVVPASCHQYINNRWLESRLWRLKAEPPDPHMSCQKATDILTRSFSNGFNFLANADSKRVVADLTGGTDSRLVLCCLMEILSKPVTTTSGPGDFIDVNIARRIASKLRLEHYWYDPIPVELAQSQLDRAVELADGNMSPLGLARQLPYYDEKARRFDFITGGGGGALFKDHYWLFEFNRVGLSREPNWDRVTRFSLVPHMVEDSYFVGYDDNILSDMTELFRRCSSQISGTNNQKLDFVYFDLKTPALAGPAFSLTTQFLDIYHPMLDGENVQFSINLPSEIRIRNILQFSMIQSLRPEIAWILTNGGLPSVPPVGLHSWLRMLRGRRYVATAWRKLRTWTLGSSGHSVNLSTDIKEIERMGYFDLLDHPSLAFSQFISASKLAAFKSSPESEPCKSYLLKTLAAQLFFLRVKEIKERVQARAVSSRLSDVRCSLGAMMAVDETSSTGASSVQDLVPFDAGDAVSVQNPRARNIGISQEGLPGSEGTSPGLVS
jgi:hypothetical protein